MQTHGTLESGTDSDLLTNSLMLVGIVALVTGMWWTIRPPDWAKPGWVREYERAQRTRR